MRDADHIPTVTLYDHAGVRPEASTSEILERVAELATGTPDAFRVRTAIALEALADEGFREAYDQHLSNGGEWRENSTLPVLPTMPAADWGSPEMDAWIEATSKALKPARRDMEGLEKVPATARRFLPLEVPNAVWVTVGTLLFLAAGYPTDSWVGNTIDRLDSIGAPLAAAFGAAISIPFAAVYNTARSWWVRATTLTAALICIPLIALYPAAALLGTVTLFGLGKVLAVLSAKAERRWIDSPRETPKLDSSWKVVDGRSTTRLGAGTGSPQQAASVLRAWASRVGFPVTDATDMDLVAAVIAADAWAFALGADSVSQAASFGPASLGAISAAISRASGHAEAGLPPLPGEMANQYRMPGLHESVRDWLSWADLMLGKRNGLQALHTAASDLVWGGGADDRLTQLGRFLLNVTR